jgi:hypothetical protein
MRDEATAPRATPLLRPHAGTHVHEAMDNQPMLDEIALLLGIDGKLKHRRLSRAKDSGPGGSCCPGVHGSRRA